MIFTVEVPDELLPGLVAELSAIPSAPSIEDYFQASAVELIRQRCESYRVGPYWAMPAPAFNVDGTPYQAPASEDDSLGES